MWIGKGIRNGINYGIYEYDEYCKCVKKKELQKQMEKGEELKKELQKERTENILKNLKERQEIAKKKRKEQEEEEEADDKEKVLKILENIDIDDIIKEFQIKNKN
jgi:hypothetical protein